MGKRGARGSKEIIGSRVIKIIGVGQNLFPTCSGKIIKNN